MNDSDDYIEENKSTLKYKETHNLPRYMQPRSLGKCFEADYQEPNTLNAKIVLCQNSQGSCNIFLTSCWAVSGFSSPPQPEYSDIHKKSKALIGFPNMLNHFFSQNVLNLCSKTTISLMSPGYEHCILLTTEGKVLTWGFGGSGCLGHGSFESLQSPKYVEELLETTCLYVEAGGYHSSAITKDKYLFTWGRNDFNQLGVSSLGLFKDSQGYVALCPQQIHYFDDILVKSVACGEAHTLVLSESGLVYQFGWTAEDELGPNLSRSLLTSEIKAIKSLKSFNVSKISAGAFFSVCITSTGELWSWGKGDEGQLGLGKDTTLTHVPQAITTIEGAMHAVCGKNFCLCVDRTLKKWAWGRGTVGVFSADSGLETGSEVVCYSPVELNSIDLVYKVLM